VLLPFCLNDFPFICSSTRCGYFYCCVNVSSVINVMVTFATINFYSTSTAAVFVCLAACTRWIVVRRMSVLTVKKKHSRNSVLTIDKKRRKSAHVLCMILLKIRSTSRRVLRSFSYPFDVILLQCTFICKLLLIVCMRASGIMYHIWTGCRSALPQFLLVWCGGGYFEISSVLSFAWVESSRWFVVEGSAGQVVSFCNGKVTW